MTLHGCGTGSTPCVRSYHFKVMEFTIDKDYNGRMNISSTFYNQKPQGNEIAQIKFNEMTVSNDMLSSFISNGYCYCPTERKKNNVRESDYICIDIDDSTIEMNEYVSTLTDKPTISYTTPSNGNVEKSQKKYGDDEHIYRFRLLYALDTPTTNATEYEQAYRYITTTNNMGFVDFRPANQFYNGSKGCELHNTHRVYTLPDEYKNVVLGNEGKKNSRPKSKQTGGVINPSDGNNEMHLDADVLSAFLDCTKYEDFLSWYNGEFGESNLLRETPYNQDEHDERKLVCDDYYVIPKKYIGWDKENKTKLYGKWVDGENRHTKIYTTGVILRKLNPEATADDLLREIVAILLTYYSLKNPDGSLKFTKRTILQLMESVMKADLDREMKKVKHSSFHVSDAYCKKNRVSKNEVVLRILSEKKSEVKEAKYSEIDYFYVHNLAWNDGRKITIEQWVSILNENGIELSKATFNRYLKERGFSRNKKRKRVKNITSKPNMNNHHTIRLRDDTFGDDEDCILDETMMIPDRKFREIVEGIHSSDEFREKWKV